MSQGQPQGLNRRHVHHTGRWKKSSWINWRVSVHMKTTGIGWMKVAYKVHLIWALCIGPEARLHLVWDAERGGSLRLAQLEGKRGRERHPHHPPASSYLPHTKMWFYWTHREKQQRSVMVWTGWLPSRPISGTRGECSWRSWEEALLTPTYKEGSA